MKNGQEDRRQEEAVREFSSLIEKRFRVYCESKDRDATIEAFVRYLIDRRIVTSDRVNRFLVLELYPGELRSKSKSKAVIALSDRLPLEERQIWNIIGNYSKFFRIKER